MFWTGLAIGVMVGSLNTAVLMAMLILGKEEDERMEKE